MELGIETIESLIEHCQNLAVLGNLRTWANIGKKYLLFFNKIRYRKVVNEKQNYIQYYSMVTLF